MAVIKYDELFDFPGYRQAIKDLEGANKEFGTTVNTINDRISKQYKELSVDLKAYKDILISFNVNQKSAAETIVQTGESALSANKKLAEQTRIMQELKGVTDLSTKSVNDLKTGMKGLESEYNSIAGKEQADIVRKKQIATEAQRVKVALTEQTTALKSSKQTLDAMEGSYNRMQAELKAIGAQLKSMPNAFDSVTGKINQNNKEAVALASRYLEVNTALKNSDAQLGNFTRNVGNYNGVLGVLSKTIKGFGGLGIILSKALGVDPAIFDGIREGGRALRDLQHAEEIEKLAKAEQTAATVTNTVATETNVVATKSATLAQRLYAFVVGESTGALKILRIALAATGIGLLLLGIGALVTMLSTASAETGRTAKATQDLSEQQARAARSLEVYNQVQKAAVKNSEQEIVSLASLVAAARNENASRTQRQNAIDQLQEKYPGYLKNISLETINSKEATTAIDELTQSILAKAVADEYAKRVAEAVIKQDDIKRKLQKEQQFDQDNQAAFNKKLAEAVAKNDQATISAMKRYGLANDQTTKTIHSLNAELEDSNKNVDDLTKGFNDATLASLKFVQDPKKKEKSGTGGKSAEELQTERIKKLQDALQSLAEKRIALFELAKETEVIGEGELAAQKLAIIEKYVQAAIDLEKSKLKPDQKVIDDLLKKRIDAEKEYTAYLNKFDKDTLEKKKKDIIIETDEKISALKDEEIETLNSKKFTVIQKLAIETDYQNKIDKLTIDSLEQRAAFEVDAEKRSAMLREAEALKRGIITRGGTVDTAGEQKSIADSLRLLDEESQKRIGIFRNRLKDEIDLLEQKKKLYIGNAEETAKIENEIRKKGLEEYAKLEQATADLVVQIRDSAFQLIEDNIKTHFENQSNALEKQKQNELTLAGNNNAARAAIEEKYAQKQNEIKVKQAKAEKVAALFRVAVDLATAVAKISLNAAALASNPLTLFAVPIALAQIPIAIIAAAIQAAFIAAQPLPKFRHGTKHSPEGYAIVDEAGPELIIDPSGRLKEIGGDQGPRITHLQYGSKVIPAPETKSILKDIETQRIIREIELTGSLSNSIRRGKRDEMVEVMAIAMQRGGINQSALHQAFENAVKKIPVHNHIYDERGYRKRIDEVNQRTTYLNDLTKL
jgi:hypothetical protein